MEHLNEYLPHFMTVFSRGLWCVICYTKNLMMFSLRTALTKYMEDIGVMDFAERQVLRKICPISAFIM